MCSPTIALSVAGLGLSAISGLQQARAAQQQATFQAAVARNNVILSQRAAEDARERGRVEANKQAARTRQFIGRQKVALAGQGQLVDTGSALDLTADAAAAGRLEELTIRNNAEREAIGFLTQGMNFQAEADLARARGASARRAGQLGFLSTIVTGAGAVSSRWRARVPTAGGFTGSSPFSPSFTGGFT